MGLIAGQVESFILARDLFLKPDGQLFPSAGEIIFCPFTDDNLFRETDQKVSAAPSYQEYLLNVG